MRTLSGEEAAEAILAGRLQGPVRVTGLLNLSNYGGAPLPDGLHCYELDLRGCKLRRLPNRLRVNSRLALDGSPLLERLPKGLTAGSISLRHCPSLAELGEDLDTWFLDLTGCERFARWPEKATIQNGSLILRGCTLLTSLPSWLKRLAHLDVSGTAIAELPEGLTITGWLDVAGARMTGLPARLRGISLRWRGVRVSERIAFHPEQLTAAEALREKNAEVRRVMIERMGYLRFAQEAGAQVLHEDLDRGGPRQLLKIDLEEDEPLVGLACRCPSTGRQYLIRVPPAMQTCHQAAAWIAGFDDPELYRPDIET